MVLSKGSSNLWGSEAAGLDPGTFPESPAAALLGVRIVPARDNLPETVAVDPLARFVDPDGFVPAGLLFMAADLALGRSISHRITPGTFAITSHLHLELVRRFRWPPGGVESVADVIATDESSGLATARFRSQSEDVAVASGRFQILPGGDRNLSAVDDGAVPELAPDGSYIAPRPCGKRERHETRSIDEVLGISLISNTGADTDLEMIADPVLANDRGGIHGGIGGLITERCATLAMRSWVNEPRQWRSASLGAFFARPIPAAGKLLRATTSIRRLGQRTLVTSTTVRDPDGKESLLGDAVHVLVPLESQMRLP